MKLSALVAASAAAFLAFAGGARAQTGGFALNQFEPAPAGDAFFGVLSPNAGGHLVPRVVAVFEEASKPIRLVEGGEETAIVSSQTFVRLDASLALWDRVLVSADVPLMLAQEGDDPGIEGITFTPLEAPKIGDLRFGVRARLLGSEPGPIQLGLGGYLFAPTGKAEQYTGEGAARGAIHAALGGRAGSSVGVVWSLASGIQLRGSASPNAFTFGGGVGLLLGGDLVQLGPEIYGAIPFSGDLQLSTTAGEISAPAETTAQLLVGGKLRFLGGLTLGAALGPGVVKGVGTPTFRAVGVLGWAPLGAPAASTKKATTGSQEGSESASTGNDEVAVTDKDNDGITDDIDACPDVKGEPSADPQHDGCPPSDRDKDGILDVDDACPNTPGLRNAEVTKNGCPKDSDSDGVYDVDDACPTEVGVQDPNPKKNGCPKDSDDDGIADRNDACPSFAGPRSNDPKQNGCPEDPDGDRIKYPFDACPNEKGEPSRDPRQNGCPRFIRVKEEEITTSKPIQFVSYGKARTQTIDVISDDVLREIRDVLVQNPDIELVEVQGHTDDMGTEEFNLRMSQERADAVREWLIQAGVPSEKLTARGYGFERPIADNRIRTGRAKNRRVQFVIVKRKGR